MLVLPYGVLRLNSFPVNSKRIKEPLACGVLDRCAHAAAHAAVARLGHHEATSAAAGHKHGHTA